MYGAGPAGSDAAAELGASQAQFIPQIPQQRGGGVTVEIPSSAIDGHADHECLSRCYVAQLVEWLDGTDASESQRRGHAVQFLQSGGSTGSRKQHLDWRRRHESCYAAMTFLLELAMRIAVGLWVMT